MDTPLGPVLRRRPDTHSDVQTPSTAAVQDAARQVLLGKYSNSSQAARALGVRYHSHVEYYVKKWRGTELGDILGVQVAMPVPSPESSPALSSSSTPLLAARGVPESQNSHVLDAMPSSVQLSSVHQRQVFLALAAVKYMDKKKVSARAAAAKVLHVYSAQRGTATVSYGTVLRYRRPHYRPVASRKTSY